MLVRRLVRRKLSEVGSRGRGYGSAMSKVEAAVATIIPLAVIIDAK